MDQIYQSPGQVLAAGAVFATPWLDVSGDGDVPVAIISVSAPQGGTYSVQETENMERAEPICGASVLAGLPTVCSISVKRRFVRVVYTQGTNPGTVVITIFAPVPAKIESQRLQELILKELRSISSLLAEMKQPTTNSSQSIPLPFGPTN